ncbi:MAG: hypothetical protein KFF46_08130 [Desulfobacterales bacterium]|nr:hypothetical protein [Desulfobacterales bacterium]
MAIKSQDVFAKNGHDREMKRRNLNKGVASFCAGGGMGTALVLERA